MAMPSPANTALRDDLEVSAEEGLTASVPLFAEDELPKPLERWFFGTSPDLARRAASRRGATATPCLHPLRA